MRNGLFGFSLILWRSRRRPGCRCLKALAFRTTPEPLFPRCEVAKSSFVHRSQLLWPQESIETIEAISSNVVPMEANYLCNQTELHLEFRY